MSWDSPNAPSRPHRLTLLVPSPPLGFIDQVGMDYGTNPTCPPFPLGKGSARAMNMESDMERASSTCTARDLNTSTPTTTSTASMEIRGAPGGPGPTIPTVPLLTSLPPCGRDLGAHPLIPHHPMRPHVAPRLSLLPLLVWKLYSIWSRRDWNQGKITSTSMIDQQLEVQSSPRLKTPP